MRRGGRGNGRTARKQREEEVTREGEDKSGKTCLQNTVHPRRQRQRKSPMFYTKDHFAFFFSPLNNSSCDMSYFCVGIDFLCGVKSCSSCRERQGNRRSALTSVNDVTLLWANRQQITQVNNCERAETISQSIDRRYCKSATSPGSSCTSVKSFCFSLSTVTLTV